MKKLTKLLSVAAALFACACATDATDDLGITLGGQTTEVAISLEESRTQLGEKVDGVYKLYWSEGDKIAINGIASDALTAEQSGSGNAQFTFAGVVAYPYNILYPASGTENVVTFLAQQSYTEGTFCNNAAPMYGYATAPAEGEEVAPIQINHLAGVLRLAVKGDKTLTSMTVVAETGAIAGNFDVNCESGALTAHEDASNTITMSFGEGLTLSDTATPIYVAVPAGEHGIYTITLFTDEAENNAMVVRFNSDNHPVKAGVVKEFGEVAFIPNATASPVSGELVIENEADLVRLAKMSEVGLLGSVTSVRVAASLDMSNVEGWHGIDRFPAIQFDGGSDKGFEIKGLKRPLFGEVTGATIKNVKLTEVAMEITDITFAGSIVCILNSAAGLPAKLEKCEASGTIIYSNNNVTLSENFATSHVNIGGLVGQANSATIVDCNNYVAITNKLSTPADIGTQKKYDSPAFGGIVGRTYLVDGLEGITTRIANCHNYGAITIDDAKAHQTYSSPVLAGIAGCVRDATAVVEYCENHAPMYQKTTCRQADIAGIVGRGYGKIDNCINHEEGDISFGAIGRYSFPGGIIGDMYGHTVSNCTNKGDITYDPKVKTNTGYQYMGGIAGHVREKNSTISNCVNEGAISNLADAYGGTSNCYVWAGGIAGYVNVDCAMSDCENKGTITMGGIKGATLAKATDAHSCIGGIVGYSADSNSALTKCNNNGEINYNVQTYDKGANGVHRVGGIVGNNEGTITECENLKPLNINTKVTVIEGENPTNQVQVGGICGYSKNAITSCVNKGTLTFGEEATAYGYCIGGLVGFADEGTIKSSRNEGELKILGDATMTTSGLTGLHIGGICGYNEATISSCNNGVEGDKTKGKITVSGKIYPSQQWGGLANSTSIGGLAGVVQGGNPTSSNNYAPIEVTMHESTPAYTIVAAPFIGGLAGYTGKTWKNCSNYGDMTLIGKNNCTKTLMFAGCISRNAKASHVNINNYGNITLKDFSSTNTIYVGGIDTGIGAATSFTDSHNYGNITVESSVTLANTYIGGIYASINANTGITNCSNKGNISFNGTATNLNIGGAAAYMKHATCQIDTFTNSGNIVFSDSATAATAWLGGIIGQVPSLSTATAGGVKNATSEANITVSGTVTSQLIMGGISGSYATKNQPMENCKFTGEIDIKRNEANSSTIKELYLGGIIGSQASQVATLTNATFAGKITYRAKSTDICRIGGIIGSNTQSTASWSGLVSAGTIDFQTNTEAVNYLASKTVIGGVIANTTSVGITGAKSHCDIYVLHLAEGAKYGMVLGVDRTSTILAKNCEVGGMIYNKWDDEEEVYDGTKLSSNNYYNYIYGSGKNTDWGDSTNYDGNIFLATKPTVQ